MELAEKLTIEDGQRALTDHATERGRFIWERYGPNIDEKALLQILKDSDCVRFPVRLAFDSSKIEPDGFAVTIEDGDKPSAGYTIYVHEHFASCPTALPALVLYQLVTVNYGDFASYRDAEAFGAAALGMDQESYYRFVCSLADSIPQGVAG